VRHNVATDDLAVVGPGRDRQLRTRPVDPQLEERRNGLSRRRHVGAALQAGKRLVEGSLGVLLRAEATDLLLLPASLAIEAEVDAVAPRAADGAGRADGAPHERRR
jgi:hypothetical protein